MNNVIKRGDVFYVKSEPLSSSQGSEIWSDRPAVIVSNNKNNEHSPAVMIVYLTTAQKHAQLPTHVQVNSCGKIATALCEQVHTIDKSRLSSYMCTLHFAEMKEISSAIALGLGITKNDQKKIVGIFSKWEKTVEKYQIPIKQENDYIREKYKSSNNTLMENLIKERDSYKQLYELNVQHTCQS